MDTLIQAYEQTWNMMKNYSAAPFRNFVYSLSHPLERDEYVVNSHWNSSTTDASSFPHEWKCDLQEYDQQLEDDFGPWDHAGITDAVFHATRRAFPDHAAYLVRDQKLYRMNPSKDHCKARVPLFMRFLLKLVRVPDVAFVIACGDYGALTGVHNSFPVLSFTKIRGTGDILIPNPDTFGQVVKQTEALFFTATTPWNKRRDSAVWRGASSGELLSDNLYRYQHRFKFVEIAQQRPDLLDVAFNHIFDWGLSPQYKKMLVEQYVKPFMSLKDQFDNYRYQLAVDGFTAAWRLQRQIGSGGVVVKVDSPYVEHFYHRLEPYVHFVPVNKNYKNMISQVEWLRQNPQKGIEIARRSMLLALQHLTADRTMCYLFRVLDKLAALQKLGGMTGSLEVQPGFSLVL